MESGSENPNGMAACPSCGERHEEAARFCVYCGTPFVKRRGVLSPKRYLLYGVISLVLVGGVGFALMGRGESALVGKVNGEGMPRKEFTKRIERIKKSFEARYGPGLFTGDAGRENLNRLKADILEAMTVEKILLQEAKTAGYTFAPREEIDRQLAAIKNAHGLSDADLQERTGQSVEELKADLEDGWIISQYIEKAILKKDRKNAEAVFGRWLTEAKAKAKIETYEKLEPLSQVRASCCKSGCGGGGQDSAS